MRHLGPALSVVALIATALFLTGCIVISEERYPGRAESSGDTGLLTIVVDPDSVKKDGPVELYIDGKFWGHVVEKTEFHVAAGERTLLLKRRGFAPYSVTVSITPQQAVLIMPVFTPGE